MSMIDIAWSGVQAAQFGMNVTSMNVANLLTPGYSRQGLLQSSIGPLGQNGLSAGNGVQVDSIRRISDQYLVNQVWRTNTLASYYTAGQQFIGALEQVIGTDSTSLGNGLNDFFSALNEMTTQPESSALRQQLLNQAQALATRFNSVNDFINNQKTAISTQRDATVNSINSLSDGIASYNQKITELESTGANTSVLRDQRDELVKQLSGLVDVKVNEDSAGNYTVALKNGLPLVAGKTAWQLSAGTDADGNPTMSLKFANDELSLNPSMGGQLGALYDYEVGTLKDMQNAVQSMAQAVADLFNGQLANGFDLNGNPGKPLFTFNPGGSGDLLQVNDLHPDELALSGVAGAPGNSDNLHALLELKNQTVSITGFGNMTLNEGAAAIISTIGIASRQNKTEMDAAETIREQVQNQRDNLSAVNQDEEAINLQIYMQAYQSNMKVIATGNQIFSDLLNMI